MSDDKLDRVLRTVDPGRRALLKKLVLGAAFAVPIVISFSVKDLANAQAGSVPSSTTTTSLKTTKTTTTLRTTTTMSTIISTTTSTPFVTTTPGP